MFDFKKYGIDMWPQDKIEAFRKTLLNWYDENKRDLPWRKTTDPYAIWVSEIMLQQTRVDTVKPYYERFLYHLPTIRDLAEAPEEVILKLWEGLGYYSRVRNMQKAAQQMVADFGGAFPKTYAEIASLKGIGPYTAGAIASIAFALPEPAVDGNVMRVMSRLFEVEYDIGVPGNRKIFQAIMEELIDPERPGDFNQALMDLGSDIEAPVNPRPKDSPVKEFSAAYLNGTMDKYPIKAPKKKPLPVAYQAFIIRNEKNEFLLEKNQQSNLLAGFWSFPLLEKGASMPTQVSLFEVAEDGPYIDMRKEFGKIYPLAIEWQEDKFSPVQHVFSHRKWKIELLEGIASTAAVPTKREVQWVAVEDFHRYPFAKPQQKMWDSYLAGKQDTK
ncbi:MULTISPECIES: A/G-specific adenine glycosylase [unclassified Streptococcus]|uniref:A/G-specific adenine glycosylase n=1 Tax=unclassified Streptococcus TaxID=2608887 RepID=UPI00142F4BAD|nr:MULTISPECIES: A/G-specific adenine glycosylase [unclassified Streptococcus]MBF0788094.1 A/G-specific adenine glycosylase [Streptococcus sp. 19428wC2_LYSM12]MCQ9212584.1 A/G-specific adenine glycosylase [Streptococcus sp. B01]MCQ9213923.1 A/G-specific adenine glycosylase [Streptococcus sp. O1]